MFSLSNEKGLMARFEVIPIIKKEVVEKLAEREDALGDFLRVLSKGCGTNKIWNSMSTKKADEWLTAPPWPTSWANESGTAEGTEADWEATKVFMRRLREGLDEHGEELKKEAEKIDERLSGERLEGMWSRVPSAKQIAKVSKEARVKEAGAEAFARGGTAWAIWMEKEKGYMDAKKRGSGIEKARLFESSAAAKRTAVAARFGEGKERGPAAVVEIAIEATAIIECEGSASERTNPVRAELARREAEELTRALDFEGETTEARGDEWGEAIALWLMHPWKEGEYAGFRNARGCEGPLAGAQLYDEKSWRSALRGSDAGVRVRVRPTRVSERLGEAPAKEVEEKIARGAAALAGEALRRAEERGEQVPAQRRRRI